MKKGTELEHLLQSLDKQKYGAYKRIKGMYQFDQFQLAIDHVQVDPYAPPSKMRIIMQRKTAGIPDEWLDSNDKIIAVADFLTRVFSDNIQKNNRNNKNEKIFIDRCGQEIIERTSVKITADTLEVRLEVGLPAAGRKILGKAAANTICETLPKLANQALLYQNIDQQAMKNQVILMLDQVFIRQELAKRNLVAFVANDSILPRKSGVSDQPLKNAVPFSSPENLAIQLELPSGKTVKGMGIPEGITLMVGGGYHGKSTLLEALERGVYQHISGDGREMVITNEEAVKIRAEDGRQIEQVNISAFINNLPGNKDTKQFFTENASGSTSQAANVMEASEAESSLLLIDEDTSATNYMIRDGRMQKLIAPEKEPITPFANKVKPLYDDKNVSTILIVGGSGDYFEVADHILMMDEYQLKDVTEDAKTIAQTDGYQRESLSNEQFGDIPSRIPLKAGFSKTGKHSRLKTKGKDTNLYGRDTTDISGLEQLVDDSQTNSIAAMLYLLQKNMLNDEMNMAQTADKIYKIIEERGLDAISSHSGHPGNLAIPRK